MRLGMVAPYADPSRGGHEKFLSRLVRGLLEKNVDITFFSRTFENFRRAFPAVECVSVPSIPFPRAVGYLSFNYFARRTVQRHRRSLDVLLTTGFVTFGDCYRAGVGLHRTFMKHRGRRWLPKPADWAKTRLQDRLFSSCGDRTYIVNSRMVRRELTSEYPHLSDRVVTVHNGIDTEQFNPYGRRQSKQTAAERWNLDLELPVLLFVGREPRRKGLDLFLKALDGIDAPYNAVTAGLPPKDVRAWLGSSRSMESVATLEYVEEMPLLYRSADLTVLPTRYDPASNVVPESLACGTPVVTTTHNGAREFIEEHVNGIVLDSPDSEALKACIEDFLNHETVLHRWSPDTDFLERLDIQRTIRRIHRVLRTHADASHPSRTHG